MSPKLLAILPVFENHGLTFIISLICTPHSLVSDQFQAKSRDISCLAIMIESIHQCTIAQY